MRYELGMADEPGLGARDLGEPQEAQAPPRLGQAAAGDGGTESARDLEDAALPDALSLAPADWWHRCAVSTISPAAGSLPGIMALTTS